MRKYPHYLRCKISELDEKKKRLLDAVPHCMVAEVVRDRFITHLQISTDLWVQPHKVTTVISVFDLKSLEQIAPILSLLEERGYKVEHKFENRNYVSYEYADLFLQGRLEYPWEEQHD